MNKMQKSNKEYYLIIETIKKSMPTKEYDTTSVATIIRIFATFFSTKALI